MKIHQVRGAERSNFPCAECSEFLRRPRPATRALATWLVLAYGAAFAWADEPNATPLAAPGSTSPSYATSLPQVGTVGAASCAYQYIASINDANTSGLALNVAGAAAAVNGAISQQASDYAQTVTFGEIAASIAGGALDGSTASFEVAGAGLGKAAVNAVISHDTSGLVAATAGLQATSGLMATAGSALNASGAGFAALTAAVKQTNKQTQCSWRGR